MLSIIKRLGVAAMAGMAALTLMASPANGQNPYFQAAPGLSLQQYYNLAAARGAYSSISPYALGMSPLYRAAALNQAAFVNPTAAALLTNNALGAGTLANNPYLSTPGAGNSPYSSPYYPPYYYQDPFNGYLTGGASVISAQSQFMISKQQSALMYEQVRQARIDTRRKMFEEYLYEREKTPTVEEERERTRIQERDRSRNDPPITEVYSAKALNDLLLDLQKLQAKGSMATYRGPSVALDEDDLKRINVTSKSGGNVGLLKNDGRLSWPVSLSGPEYKEEKERLGSLALEVVKQAGFNTPVDPGTLQQMSADLDKISKQLVKHVGDLPPAQYIEAKRFLSDFADAIKALRQPDASNYFTKKLKGKTVPELVDYMTKQGLQFAPAVAGDESAYLTVHRALAAYDLALVAQASP